VTGILANDEVVVTQPIGLVHYPGVAEGLYAACSSGKPAMSKVCVLERLAHQNQTLVQVEIHSGRPHQIRIHLAYIGHPLVADIKSPQQMILCMVLVGTPNLLSQNLLARIVLLHMMGNSSISHFHSDTSLDDSCI